jgi:hypothetical protein
MVEAQTLDETLYCAAHPAVETTLRCNRCGNPMCISCAVRTPVGYRCKACVKGQKANMFNARTSDPIIQFLVSLVLSGGAAALIGGLGAYLWWYFIIPAAALAGAAIADIAHRAVQKRRGEYAWLAVAAGIVLGAIIIAAVPTLLYGAMLQNMYSDPSLYADPEVYADATIPTTTPYPSFAMMMLGGFTSYSWWIYLIVAAGSAIGRLKLGSRINFDSFNLRRWF